jgi:hypothetical protein
MTEKTFDLKKFIEKELRRAFRRSPMFSAARNVAKEEFFVKSKHDKDMRRVHFKCAKCGRKFVDKTGSREIAVDHRNPVVDPVVGFVDFNTYITRLFCGIENLDVLCNYKGLRDGIKACHRLKTAEENRIRREAEAIRNPKPPKQKRKKK